MSFVPKLSLPDVSFLLVVVFSILLLSRIMSSLFSFSLSQRTSIGSRHLLLRSTQRKKCAGTNEVNDEKRDLIIEGNHIKEVVFGFILPSENENLPSGNEDDDDVKQRERKRYSNEHVLLREREKYGTVRNEISERSEAVYTVLHKLLVSGNNARQHEVFFFFFFFYVYIFFIQTV